MPLNRRAALGFLTVSGVLTTSVWPLRALAAQLPVTPLEPEEEAAAPEANGPAAGGSDGFIVFEAKAGAVRLRPEPARETAVWGFNGQVPGPLLRVKKGAEVKVRLVNSLDQPVSLSWQGVRGPNAMDGVAGLTQSPVKPGERFDYRFTPPDAGLFWYHSHVWPHTAEQTGRGLYGVLIVEEPDPPEADEDLLAVLDDWSLDGEAQIKNDFGDAGQAMHAGRIGSLLTVDSHPVPFESVMRPGSRVRLRIVSAACAQIFIVTFEGTHPQVQAIDGQPCETFEPVRQTLPIGPGARFDVMLDLPAGAGEAVRVIARGDGVPDRPLLAIKTAGEPRKPHGPITDLTANAALPAAIPLERAFRMDLVIDGGAKPAAPSGLPLAPQKGGAAKLPVKAAPEPIPLSPADPAKLWTLNGVASDGFSGKPLFKVKRGEAVSLAFVNRSAFPQQMQIRGHAFRLLHDLDDGWEPYWRDAVLIAPSRTKHVAFIASNPGKWAIESLILDRQVTGLAGWFEVA